MFGHLPATIWRGRFLDAELRPRHIVVLERLAGNPKALERTTMFNPPQHTIRRYASAAHH